MQISYLDMDREMSHLLYDGFNLVVRHRYKLCTPLESDFLNSFSEMFLVTKEINIFVCRLQSDQI